MVLWAMAVVPKIILQDSGSRLVCQLDNWAALFAPMLSIAYIIMATIRVTKGKHWGVKLLEWTICVLTSGMRHPKRPLRSNRGLIARCSSVRNKVLVSLC